MLDFNRLYLSDGGLCCGKEGAWLFYLVILFYFTYKKRGLKGILTACLEWVLHSCREMAYLRGALKWYQWGAPGQLTMLSGPPLRVTCHPVRFFQRMERQGRHRSPEGKMHEPLPVPGTAEAKPWAELAGALGEACRNWPFLLPFTLCDSKCPAIVLGTDYAATMLTECWRYFLSPECGRFKVR